ncbi:MAG TPA: NAD-dependent epimerase/dehydratase family protein [Candidatus Acidoferrum sp.]|jgi:dTDP-L-rhamnose 4-epimerase
MTLRIGVLGGAGFVGSHLVDALVKQGFRVRVVDNLDEQVHPGGVPPAYLNPDAEFIRQDIRNYDGLRKAIAGVDAIFHLAGAVGVGDSMYRIRHYADVNVLGGANLLDLLANEKHSVRKIVLASSVTIYGEGKYSCPRHGAVFPMIRSTEQITRRQWELRCPAKSESKDCAEKLAALPTDEEKPVTPVSVYAITKRTQEEMFLAVGRTYGISTTVLRYFNVYGSRQAISNPYTGVGKIFAAQLSQGKPPIIYEDGLQSRDFVHVDDVVQANILALQHKEGDGEVFNVGTGRRTTILEMAEAVAKQFGAERAFEPSHQCRAGDVRHCWADISKIRTLLGFTPRTVFPDGLGDLLSARASVDETGEASRVQEELTQRGLIS